MTAFEEQKLIDQQNELEEKHKQLNATSINIEDGYEQIGEVCDLFRNDYFQEYYPEYTTTVESTVCLEPGILAIGFLDIPSGTYLVGQDEKMEFIIYDCQHEM